MEFRWQDVSIPMRPGMTVWPGDPDFALRPASRISEGDACNTSVMTCATHTGTHCDAPWHFENDGKRLHAVNPDVFFGDARVIHVPEVDLVTADDLPGEPLPPRVLFKTRNADIPLDAPFQDDFVALDESAARRLVDDGVRLVGIDYLSIAPKGNAGPTHHVLLGNEVFVVEGLVLRHVPAGTWPFVVMPMAVQEADGAPCRAFIGLPRS